VALWSVTPTPDDINAKLTNTMAGILGITVTEVGEDFLQATMPLSDKTRQYMGIIHGGANVVLAETIGNIAANHCCEAGKTVVGLEINANHIRPGKTMVTATAKPLHIGRTTMVWEIKIHNTENKLTCVSRFTGAVISITD